MKLKIPVKQEGKELNRVNFIDSNVYFPDIDKKLICIKIEYIYLVVVECRVYHIHLNEYVS